MRNLNTIVFVMKQHFNMKIQLYTNGCPGVYIVLGSNKL